MKRNRPKITWHLSKAFIALIGFDAITSACRPYSLYCLSRSLSLSHSLSHTHTHNINLAIKNPFGHLVPQSPTNKEAAASEPMGVCEKLFTALHLKARRDSATDVTSKPPPAKPVKEAVGPRPTAAPMEEQQQQQKKKKKNINERAAEYIKTARIKIRAASFSRAPTSK